MGEPKTPSGITAHAQTCQVNAAVVHPVRFGHFIQEREQNILRRFIEENMRRGVTAEQFEKDKAQLYDGARKSAAARVRTRFLLAKVAELGKGWQYAGYKMTVFTASEEIPIEEQFLHERFGAPYDEYTRRVRRWL